MVFGKPLSFWVSAYFRNMVSFRDGSCHLTSNSKSRDDLLNWYLFFQQPKFRGCSWSKIHCHPNSCAISTNQPLRVQNSWLVELVVKTRRFTTPLSVGRSIHPPSSSALTVKWESSPPKPAKPKKQNMPLQPTVHWREALPLSARKRHRPL